MSSNGQGTFRSTDSVRGNRVFSLVRHRRSPLAVELCYGLLLVALLLGACATHKPVTLRGRQVDANIVGTEHELGFSCALIASTDSIPRLRFERRELVTYHEVPLYQKVIEYRHEGDASRENVQTEVVPGEYIEGTPRTRSEQKPAGWWSEERFAIEGVSITTDANGVYVDRNGILLRAFDDLSCKLTQFTVEHQDLGRRLLSVTRDELLAALRVNQQTARRTETDGVRVQVDCPARIRSGMLLEMVVNVANEGPHPVCGMLARTFSRHAWLDGRTFYIGTLAAGQARNFRRFFQVPEEVGESEAHMAVGFWSILGAMPEKNVGLTVSIEVAGPAR